jgi:hypothetical protein
MAKPFEIRATVNGEEITFRLDKHNWWHLGPAEEMKAYDSTASGDFKSNEDRVALGRFFMEIGTKLATPKKETK